MLRDDGQASALYRKVIAECERTRAAAAAAAAAADGAAATEPAASAREEANAGEEAGFWDTESTLVLARYNLASVLMLTRPGGEARREAFSPSHPPSLPPDTQTRTPHAPMKTLM